VDSLLAHPERRIEKTIMGMPSRVFMIIRYQL